MPSGHQGRGARAAISARTQRILAFLAETERMKLIERTVDCLDGKRVESNAEHVWEVCMFILLLQDTFPASTDILKMLQLALVHDLPEIYAGDTYFMDESGRSTKRERERIAKEKLFGMLPEDIKGRLDDLFEEYEAKASEEAKLVNAIEKLQPMFQILNTGGERMKRHKVRYRDQDNNKRRHMEPNKDILAIYEHLMAKLKAYYQTEAPELLADFC